MPALPPELLQADAERKPMKKPVIGITKNPTLAVAHEERALDIADQA